MPHNRVSDTKYHRWCSSYEWIIDWKSHFPYVIWTYKLACNSENKKRPKTSLDCKCKFTTCHSWIPRSFRFIESHVINHELLNAGGVSVLEGNIYICVN